MEDSSFNKVLQRAIESSKTGVVIADYQLPDVPLIYINPIFEEMTGYTVEECLGKNCRFLQGPDTDPEQVAIIREAIKNGKECKVRLLNYRKDGTSFWNELSLSPVFDEAGKLTHYIGIQDDISKEIENEEKLKTARAAAESASKLKTEFLNIISHELRTPLTVMLGNLPLLKDPEQMPDNEEVAEIASDIEESGLHLLELINELLDISRIEEGRMKLDRQNLSVKDCLEDALHQVHHLADHKGLEIKINDKADFIFFADQMRVKQILINLLGNAIKFTDEGFIEITTDVNEQMGLISNRDTGCGIEEKFLPHVFDVFRRADGTVTRARSGSGLGLAITKKLVNIQEGRIEAESTFGQGSTFSIFFPIIS